jgi:predicted amidophosphoribosyltransferase
LRRLAAESLAELACLASLFPVSPVRFSAADVRTWPAYRGEVCPRCGAFMGMAPPRGPQFACRSCTPPPPFDCARSLFVYEGGVREGIRAAKYARHAVPADALAERLLEAVRGEWRDRIPSDFRPAIVPVPIRPAKYFQRGFNLPALVGQALARLGGWPFAPSALRRAAAGLPQAGRHLADREENVRDVFQAAPGRGLRPEILLVDDVYTSGATSRACSRALKTAGGRHIVVLTVARTVP